MARSRMRVESTCIRQIKKKTGATIFLNRMALPLVVPQCEVGGAAPDEICVLLLQFLSSWVLAHTCTAIDANGQAMRMVRRCEWSGDANGQAMRMVMRRGIAAIVYLQLAERACFSWTISPGEGQPASCGVSTHEE